MESNETFMLIDLPVARRDRWYGFLLPTLLVLFSPSGPAGLQAQSVPTLRVAFQTDTQIGLCWAITVDPVGLEEADAIAPGASWRLVSTPSVASNGSVCVSVDIVGGNRFFRLHRIDADGLPPDPVAVAPSLAPGVFTPLPDMAAFLYSGPNPIQTGLAANALQPGRTAVLRGRVLQGERRPLPGVTISILNQPALGQTLSRVDGQFDLVVNGGGPLVVNLAKPGFLPAQRQVDVPWQDFASVPDVLMIPTDSLVTSVALGASAPPQLHRGSQQTDTDGMRQATVLIPPGITAVLVMPDGSTQAVTSLNLRATEYTVGPNGPEAMPAELPPTSAYTYCVELSADEAIAAGAKDVRFGSALPFYVENFLKFPVGTTVPVGSYDRARGTWIPERSGKVIKVVGITSGAADLDTDGNGAPDDAATLAGLSITDTERQQLAGLYSPGQSLWRALVPHFTPWDLNWPYGLPNGAQAPDQDPRIELCMDANCQQSGNSIIECENQILGEEVPVVGTPFALHYSSQRVPGRNAANTVEIPLTGDVLPPDLAEVRLQIEIAGQLFRRSFPPQTNQATTFTWNGRDAYGRALHGQQRIVVRIGYTYPAAYTESPAFGETGANFILEADPVRQLITLWRVWEKAHRDPLRPTPAWAGGLSRHTTRISPTPRSYGAAMAAAKACARPGRSSARTREPGPQATAATVDRPSTRGSTPPRGWPSGLTEVFTSRAWLTWCAASIPTASLRRLLATAAAISVKCPDAGTAGQPHKPGWWAREASPWAATTACTSPRPAPIASARWTPTGSSPPSRGPESPDSAGMADPRTWHSSMGPKAWLSGRTTAFSLLILSMAASVASDRTGSSPRLRAVATWPTTLVMEDPPHRSGYSDCTGSLRGVTAVFILPRLGVRASGG